MGDDDLLELLALPKHVGIIQQHLHKLFAGVCGILSIVVGAWTIHMYVHAYLMPPHLLFPRALSLAAHHPHHHHPLLYHHHHQVCLV